MSHRTSKVAEGVVIVLGVLSFWPMILGYDSLAYQAGLIVVLVLLSILAVVRFRRVRRALDREYILRATERRP